MVSRVCSLASAASTDVVSGRALTTFMLNWAVMVAAEVSDRGCVAKGVAGDLV